jgi:hypothetical protein
MGGVTLGQKDDGSLAPVELDAEGNVKVVGEISVEGGATAENQDELKAEVNDLDPRIDAVTTAVTALQTALTTAVNAVTTAVTALQATIDNGVSVSGSAVSVSSSALPTGAAAEAKQDAGNSSLSAIATNTGQGATAANQTTANASLSTIATNTGLGATAANQATANTSLATIATNSGLAPLAEDGTRGVICTANKPLTGADYAWRTDVSVALETSSVSLNGQTTMRKAEFRLDATAPTNTYYLQILNAGSLPADGAVTHLLAPRKIVHTNGTDDNNIIFDCTDNGTAASAGVVWCLSTTEFTKTLSGAYVSGTVWFA